MRHTGSKLRTTGLALFLLFTGWSTAQTGGSTQNSSGQDTLAQAQPTAPDAAQAAGSQAAGTQAATPTDALISALRKSLVQEARGEALLELIFPPSGTPTRRARMLPRLGAVPALIRRNFVVTVTPDTVAGRPALRYLLTPNNAQAGRWTVWIDSRWNVPLAYQEQMPGGALARRAALLSVNAGLSRVATAGTGQPGTVQTPAPALKRALLGVLPGLSLPAGFEPVSVKRRAAATEVVLSDGLNVLALVVSARAVEPASGVAVRRLGAQSVWLVGNLPQSALEGSLSGIQRLDTAALRGMAGTFGGPVASEE